MDLLQAIEARVSCRAYESRPLSKNDFAFLAEKIAELNALSGLRFQLYGPREGTDSALDLAGAMFAGHAPCYAALVAPDDPVSGDRVGYYGERLVLEATARGLGTCWVAGTFDRKTTRAELGGGERLWDVVPIGYAMEKTPLKQRLIRNGLRARGKKPEQLADADRPWAELPGWFRAGVEAAAKGPSAVNRQPVVFRLRGGRVTAHVDAGRAGLEYNDMGIAKLHFELAAAANGFSGRWGFGPDAAFAPAEAR